MFSLLTVINAWPWQFDDLIIGGGAKDLKVKLDLINRPWT